MAMAADTGIPPVIGIIGGSGIYDLEGLTAKEWRRVSTPFGDPSDELLLGELEQPTQVGVVRLELGDTGSQRVQVRGQAELRLGRSRLFVGGSHDKS